MLENIDKHTYRILHSRYQPETKIHDIYQEILYVNPNYRSEFLLTLSFPESVYNFLLVYEWIAFEEFENFHTALSLVYTDEMYKVLKHKLNLAELASIMKNAQQAIAQITLQYSSNLKDNIKQMNQLRDTAAYQQHEKIYQEQKIAIYKHLLSYVNDNMIDFP